MKAAGRRHHGNRDRDADKGEWHVLDLGVRRGYESYHLYRRAPKQVIGRLSAIDVHMGGVWNRKELCRRRSGGEARNQDQV